MEIDSKIGKLKNQKVEQQKNRENEKIEKIIEISKTCEIEKKKIGDSKNSVIEKPKT